MTNAKSQLCTVTTFVTVFISLAKTQTGIPCPKAPKDTAKWTKDTFIHTIVLMFPITLSAALKTYWFPQQKEQSVKVNNKSRFLHTTQVVVLSNVWNILVLYRVSIYPIHHYQTKCNTCLDLGWLYPERTVSYCESKRYRKLKLEKQ